MNGLSWLIYLAEIGRELGGFFTFLAVVAGIAAIGFMIAAFSDETKDVNKPTMWARSKISLAFMVLAGFMAAVMPGRQTVLLIAASEIGERALNSEKMAKITDRVGGVVDPSIDLLQTWIAKQTEDLKSQMQKPASGQSK